MALALNVQATEFSLGGVTRTCYSVLFRVGDVLLMYKARKLHLPDQVGLVKWGDLHKLFEYDFSKKHVSHNSAASL